MAYESIAITAGSGTNVACDLVSTQYLQVCKLDVGADGVSAPLSNTAPMPTRALPMTSGGVSTFHLVAAGTTNATRIKSGAGMVYGIDLTNTSGALWYLKFHDSAASPPTAGAGVVRSVAIQAGVSRRLEFPLGLAFSTGIGITTVTDLADGGTTALAASSGVLDIDWI
jgi:hypothetical protein